MKKEAKYPRFNTMIVELEKCSDGKGIHDKILQKISQEKTISLVTSGKSIDDLHYQKHELIKKLYPIFLTPSLGRNLQYRFANYLLHKDKAIKEFELEKPITGSTGNLYKIDVYGFDPYSKYDVYVECRGTNIDADDIKEVKQEVEDIRNKGDYIFNRVIVVTAKSFIDSAIRAITTEKIKMPSLKTEGLAGHHRVIDAILKATGEEIQIELYREKELSNFEKIK